MWPNGPLSSQRFPSMPCTNTVCEFSPWNACTLPSTCSRFGGTFPNGPCSSHKLPSGPKGQDGLVVEGLECEGIAVNMLAGRRRVAERGLF